MLNKKFCGILGFLACARIMFNNRNWEEFTMKRLFTFVLVFFSFGLAGLAQEQLTPAQIKFCADNHLKCEVIQSPATTPAQYAQPAQQPSRSQPLTLDEIRRGGVRTQPIIVDGNGVQISEAERGFILTHPPDLPIPSYQTTYNSDGGYGYPVGNYGYGGGFYNPFAYRDFTNREKYGLLKIDGPDKFLQKVRVVIDGRDATVASKANNAWNKPVLLPAGPHIVEFVREEKGKIQAFRRDVEVVPISVQITVFGKPEPVYLRVSGNEFENAREIYEYQQHRYVETSSGKIERKP